jgi:hypothetical protein
MNETKSHFCRARFAQPDEKKQAARRFFYPNGVPRVRRPRKLNLFGVRYKNN